ncbi:Tn3 family transposase [Nocardia sp. NPDC004568]|uniref:Tn3 family transposase n=1 Tax=Nocardia sp. NPDC004568 TaxID=3154551 RepID=UPI0033A2479C
MRPGSACGGGGLLVGLAPSALGWCGRSVSWRGRRKFFEEAPTGFVQAKRRGYLASLSASGRQHTLAAALKEYGALRRTIYAAKYLAEPDICRS